LKTSGVELACQVLISPLANATTMLPSGSKEESKIPVTAEEMSGSGLDTPFNRIALIILCDEDLLVSGLKEHR